VKTNDSTILPDFEDIIDTLMSEIHTTSEALLLARIVKKTRITKNHAFLIASFRRFFMRLGITDDTEDVLEKLERERDALATEKS
jgi:hypothetical protein